MIIYRERLGVMKGVFHFFALLSRMKYINRWGLMRNTRPENLEEHSLETAVLAHALAVIGNKRFGKNYDTGRIITLALYHDVSEIFTGDMPTPVKYFNPDIRDAYKKVEKISADRLLQTLPDDIRPAYRDILVQSPEETGLWRIIKAADKLSALCKCVEEEKAGNGEFKKAAAAQIKSLREMKLPEADVFIEEFLPSYSLTLDEQE